MCMMRFPMKHSVEGVPRVLRADAAPSAVAEAQKGKRVSRRFTRTRV